MSPEEQALDHIARFRAAKEAQDAGIAALSPDDDDDVAEAEIVG